MNDIRTSAPGKVIIAGEYAVLDGAPAICMAVDRRAHVSITQSDGEFHNVIAPGHVQSAGRFAVNESGLDWLDGNSDFPLLTAVWQALDARPVRKLSIVLDSNEFVDVETRSKFGIGSSAALTVALTAALDLAMGGGRNVHGIAADAHRRLQDGAGSGADVASCLSGGLIEYRMGDSPRRALRWPAALHYALLWTGVSADTRQQIAKWTQTEARGSRAELAVVSGEVAAAWQGGDAAEIMTALQDYAAVLRRCDADHALGIYDSGHTELANLAKTCGVLYKPCGAGGGDLGLVVASDNQAVVTFINQARDLGFRDVRMVLDPSGLRCEGALH